MELNIHQRDDEEKQSAGARVCKLLLIEVVGASDREAVLCHPEVAALIRDGWRVARFDPRIADGGKPQLLVVLAKEPDA